MAAASSSFGLVEGEVRERLTAPGAAAVGGESEPVSMSGVRLNPALQGFRCLRCETDHPIDDYFEGCPACLARGHASSLAATYEVRQAGPTSHLPFLGLPSLGDGETPLLALSKIAAELELGGLWLKAESHNPTGSHKDRMSAMIVARASMLGSPRILVASSGNAGVSLAAYAKRVGLGCTVLIRTGLEGTWENDMADLGAEVVVASSSEERWVWMSRMVRDRTGYPATNYRTPPVGSNPFGVQGYKAIGHEIAAELAEGPPDAVLVPTARGDLLWGIWEGLREAGAVTATRCPKMIVVDPFVRTEKVLAGADYRDHFPGTSEQVSIASTTVTWQTVHTLRASGGLAIAVGDAAATAAQLELFQAGIPLERCSAAPLAALRRLRAAGALPAGARVVLVGTADGCREDLLPELRATT